MSLCQIEMVDVIMASGYFYTFWLGHEEIDAMSTGLRLFYCWPTCWGLPVNVNRNRVTRLSHC